MRCDVHFLKCVIYLGSSYLLFGKAVLGNAYFNQHNGKQLQNIFETYQGLSIIRCSRVCQSRSHVCSGANYNQQTLECGLSNDTSQLMTDTDAGQTVALILHTETTPSSATPIQTTSRTNTPTTTPTTETTSTINTEPTSTTTTETTRPTTTKGICIASCVGVSNGDYQSCTGCHVYATCFNDILSDSRPCNPSTLVWNDKLKLCDYTSDTCTE